MRRQKERSLNEIEMCAEVSKLFLRFLNERLGKGTGIYGHRQPSLDSKLGQELCSRVQE
jgi:hypothetical protein